MYKFKRGSSTLHKEYIGPEGSLSIDTGTKMLMVHDGVTKGGHPAGGVSKPPTATAPYVLHNGAWVATGAPLISPLPGPDTFIGGDETAGFYGEVTNLDLFYPDEISQLTGISAGTVWASEAWLKFSLNGKILYIAKQAVRYNLTWQNIYQAGCVYGVDGPGPYPSGTAVNQLKIVTRNGHKYKVRLMTGAEANPSTASLSLCKPSEWNKLILKVWEVVAANQEGDNWANYTHNQLTKNNTTTVLNMTFCQESHSATTANRILRGTSTSLDSISNFSTTQASTEFVWRPVLEYIPPA